MTSSQATGLPWFGRWSAFAVAVLLGVAITVPADEPKTSTKERLEELRKQREQEEGKPVKPTPAERKKSAGEFPWASPDDVNYVDSLLEEEWKALGFPVSEICTDGEFIRRASLDIIGRIPSLEETQEFLRDKTADRRVRLINRLLAKEEYGKNFANIWGELLITDGRAAGNNQDINPKAMRSWLEKEFNRNTPWNKMVADLLSSEGRWDENGAVNFIIANQMGGDGTRVTSYVSRLFLCVQTQCTECHDHPWNEWKQEQFHGLKAFFMGTRERRVTTTRANGQVATDYYELSEMPYQDLGEKGAYFERRNGLQHYTLPTYLDGRDVHALRAGVKAKEKSKKLAFSPNPTEQDVARFLQENVENTEPVYLRKELAKVITSDDNVYFARAIVNRLWYHYMGHSFIKNVDDFDNGQDEPSMPDLLDKMAEDFRLHNYDLKRLTRWICSSKAYSLSTKSKGRKANDEAVGFFTTMLVKPMTPEQLYDSVLTLTQVHKASKSADTTAERDRFLQEFIRTFGTDELATTKPKYNGTITQALMLMNSGLMTQACSCAPGTFLHSLINDKSMTDGDLVDALYMAAYCRKPTGAERNEVKRMTSRAKNKHEALEDVLWVLINSGEFILNY